MSDTLTVKQAAEESNRDPKTIRREIHAGRLEAARDPSTPAPGGGIWRIKRSSFEAVILAANGRTYVAPKTGGNPNGRPGPRNQPRDTKGRFTLASVD